MSNSTNNESYYIEIVKDKYKKWVIAQIIFCTLFFAIMGLTFLVPYILSKIELPGYDSLYGFISMGVGLVLLLIVMVPGAIILRRMWTCPNCHKSIATRTNFSGYPEYCSHCGIRIKD